MEIRVYMDRESLELTRWEGVAATDFGSALSYARHTFFGPCHKVLGGAVRYHHHMHMTSNVAGRIGRVVMCL
ncbi:hypothetical protein TorRG33x02_116300 [Trema orientale]|uniref:Uncharacterized protein n=1 Tax=Trema orientale TaxID=63057 RepID=A0A2P5F427_TREOI|nr:hypothetical protein TorRG33x02_116300 [Trema orientale]